MTARLLLVASLLLAACSADHGPRLTASPSHASLFGQVDVTLTGDLAALGDIRSVTVGGIAAYDLRASPGALTITLQGAPTPGAVAVEVIGAHGSSLHHGAFTYDPPAAGVPLSWAAFGASFTHGCVSLGIDSRTQVRGIAGDIARAAGVYLGLPLFAEGLMPELQPSDFNADCSPKSGAGSIDAGKLLTQIGDKLTDPATGLYDLRRGRIDPTLVPRNVAVGGSKVSDVLAGGSSYVALLEHLVEDPNVQGGDALSQLDVSQIDRLEKLDPDVAFSTDLMGNDMDMAVIGADDLHPESMTDLATMQAGLTQMMARLGKLHGHYFIANMPSLTAVPNVALLRAQLVAAGTSTDAFDAKVKQIDALADGYNAALVQATAPYPNLHIVDFKGQVTSQLAGIRVGGEWLSGARFGGLFSLDGLHLTDTAYGLYANLFLDAINGVLRTQIAHVDVDAIHALDTDAPSVLRAAGLTCVPPAR
ncbi:MAG TPA: hypothetical protein VF945_10490 [Polyangia bacterium]